MREGRRQRLGLQEGTEGTVEDTYLDRILEEEGPRTLALDPGAFVDTTDQRYVQDAYNYYLGGGFPEEPEPVIDTPVVDTTPVVDAGGGGGGMDQATQPFQDLVDPDVDIDEVALTGGLTDAPAGGADMGTVPTDADVAFQDMGDADVGVELLDPTQYVGNLDDYDDLDDYNAALANAQGLTGPTVLDAPEVFDINEVGDPALNPGSTMVQGDDPYGTPEQQNLISQAFSKVGSTAENIMDDLSKIPGAVVDYANQTVDILGKKINVGKTLLSAGINKIVGGPISLVFDALGALDLPGGPTAQTSKAQSIGLAGEGQYKDKYGINTQSQFGDYDQYNIDRVAELEDIVADQKARKLTDTLQMKELKDRKEYNKISGVGGDIDDDPTGDAQIAEQIEADNRAAEADRIEAERRALQEINAAAAREQAAAEQRARDETDARMAAEAASRAAAAAAAAREAARNQGGGNNGGGGQNTGGARGGGTSATSSGLGNLGFSDIRLKDNVELIGKSPSNINIYKFNYKGDSTVYEGVIANEVPWASVEASNGYLMVDYNKIDVELKKHAKR